MNLESLKNTASPWGKIQTAEVIAPGIVSVTTAGHGGILLSPERFAKMPEKYRDTFAGGRWYEEDCDWAKVAVTFPEHFPATSVEHAKKTIAWLDSR